jgi:hypothetical protein
VAVNKNDWTTVKKVEVDNPINTDPLVWGAMHAVVFGDTQGIVYAFSTADAAPGSTLLPVPLFAGGPGDPGGGQLKSTVKLSDTPFQAGWTYSQFSGVGTSPMLASGRTGEGLMLLGVNTGATDGMLVAYRAGAPYNTYWQDPRLGLSSPSPVVGPNSTVTISGRVGLAPLFPAGKKFSIGWFLKADDGTVWRLGSSIIDDVAALAAGPMPVQFTFKVDPNYRSGIIYGVTNESVVLLSQSQPEGKALRELLAGAIRSGFSTPWTPELVTSFSPDTTDLSRFVDLGLPAEYPVKTEMKESKLDGALADNIGTVRMDIADNDLRLTLQCPPSNVDMPFIVMVSPQYTSNTGQNVSVELHVRYSDSAGQTGAAPIQTVTLAPGSWTRKKFTIDNVAYGNVDVTAEAAVLGPFDDTHPENNTAHCTVPVKPACLDCQGGTDDPGASLNG